MTALQREISASHFVTMSFFLAISALSSSTTLRNCSVRELVLNTSIVVLAMSFSTTAT
jgi:hypothetical protein